jgi:hypothetical protein
VRIGTDGRAPTVVNLFIPSNLVSLKAKFGLLFSGGGEGDLEAGRVCFFASVMKARIREKRSLVMYKRLITLFGISLCSLLRRDKHPRHGSSQRKNMLGRS